MDQQTLFWVIGRISGLASFATLSLSLLTGLALRTAVLDFLGPNRGLRSLHEYTALLWLPLGGLHIAGLLLDQTARVGPLDLLVPFQAPYDPRGQLAIGLGTVTLQLFLLVALTGWLRGRLSGQLWRWLHRLSYLAFGLLFLHAVLAGTDFSDPLVSALTWSMAGALAVLSLARMVWGRLPARRA
ncbi:MAG: ferric reductase-like transmembrane domain-containing protein [Candidatus Dormibacter sp.]|uniref:ferric reductase-like transmembrane domain-containing protein n=1 Tax=Candidatus Dormibacter sp. TaxID=2973982 RepID=UPI000DB14098|nr:MAG: hypothetical protein DLM66_14085 [Candidatus Dormibacteraeota bacterium]